jgi:hypothetical protein
MDSFGCHTRTKGHDERSIGVGITLGVLLPTVSHLCTTSTTTTRLLNELPGIIGEILQKSRSDLVCLTQPDEVLPDSDAGKIHFLVCQKSLQLSNVALVQVALECFFGRCSRGGRSTFCPQTMESTLVLVFVQVSTFSTCEDKRSR